MAGTIDGSQWRGIGAARRAYQEHQRVLALDPSRKDAALTVGMYRFLDDEMCITESKDRLRSK